MTVRSAPFMMDLPSAALGLVVANLPDIADMFGQSGVACVLVKLAARVERAARLAPGVVTIRGDGVYFPTSPDELVRIMWEVDRPVRVGNDRAVMALRSPWGASGWAPPRGAAFSHLISDDMELAANLYEGIRAGRTWFVIQPICRFSSSEAGSDILYWECLSRVADISGRPISPAQFIPALERSGLTRHFDAHVVSSALDLLDSGETISLGCNISAQSAVDDEWWTGIIARLTKDPALASRLVIEITETAPVTDQADYIRFVERMRGLGCRIALDDFGAGYHSIDLARRCPPDIIKIDATFLPRAGGKAASLQLFQRMVSLAGALAGLVVVEGIEDEAERLIAAQSGVLWMQGYHLAKPLPSANVLRGADPPAPPL